MLEIEFEDPTVDQCECCGAEEVRLTRFVYQDGDAFAVYYAKFTRGHSKPVVYGLIGLGAWGKALNLQTDWPFHSEYGPTTSTIKLGLSTEKNLLGAMRPT